MRRGESNYVSHFCLKDKRCDKSCPDKTNRRTKTPKHVHKHGNIITEWKWQTCLKINEHETKKFNKLRHHKSVNKIKC